TLDDERFKAVLDRVDRKRAVWGAADLAKLGRPQVVSNLGAELNPVFEHAEMLSGGVTFGDELRVVIDFVSRDDAGAGRLTDHLDGLRKVAALALLGGFDEYKKA